MIKITFKQWAEEHAPQLLQEWDYELNERKPEEYGYISKQKVHWIQIKEENGEKVEYRWEENIRSRKCKEDRKIARQGNYKNFKEWAENNNPKLLEEWDYELNKKKPEECSCGSHQKVFWTIYDEKYGKKFKLTWEAGIHTRVMGASCPYLKNQAIFKGYNDFETYCKENNCEKYLEQWSSKNDVKPDELTWGSTKIITWECKTCGNEWSVALGIRLGDNTDCPYCKNKRVISGQTDFQTWLDNHPDIEKYIDKSKNKNVDFTKIAPHSRRFMIDMKCYKCGYEWRKQAAGVVKKSGCPKCHSSKGEDRIKLYLEDKNISYQFQYKFPDCRYKRKLPFDFAVFDKERNLKCLIEFDGIQHFKPTKFTTSQTDYVERFENTKKCDQIKDNYCEEHDIPLIRIPYTEFDNIENFLDREFQNLHII